jgi:hypothetical protein
MTALTRSAPSTTTLLILCVLACGCASTPEISVERDPDLSLAGARSYGWFDPLGTDRAEYESLVTGRLKRAVGEALEDSGLIFDAEDPDVRVNFYVNLEDRQEVREVFSDPVAVRPLGRGRHYFGYRSGFYDPWPGYELEVTEYRQGTLSIDLVDTATGRLAWVGVLEGRVREDSLGERDEALRSALAELFARFP